MTKCIREWGAEVSRFNSCMFEHESKQVRCLVHGDDFVCVGEPADMKWLRTKLGVRLEIKSSMVGMDAQDGEIREEQWFITVKQLQKGGWVIKCKSDAHAVALKKAIKQSPEQQSKKKEEKVIVKIPSGVAKNSSKFFLTGISRYSTEPDLINAMQQQRPDLVILDLMMPEMDGFAVIDAMQADPQLADVPVILHRHHLYRRHVGAIRKSSQNSASDTLASGRDATVP